MNKIKNLIQKRKTFILLCLILITGFYFRTFNINWDNNYYFHPDERAIVMFTVPLKLPASFSQFLSIDSPLNPHFFAYGNFPIYVLRLASEIASHFNPILNAYGGMHIVGRYISALSDTLSILVIYFIAKRFSKTAGVTASFLYATAVFPIQLSHFFAVDTILTLFMLLTLLFLLRLYEKPDLKRGIPVGIFAGLCLATKISSLIIGLDILFVLFIVITNLKLTKNSSFKILGLMFSIIIPAIILFFATQPYTFIDFKNFIQQTQLQSQMSKNAFIFPYTLQYVGKIPYLYEFKNIFLWGLGPLTSLVGLLGLLTMTFYLFKNSFSKTKLYFVLLFYFYSYFLLFGSFAVGWMRYMLPIYPLLAIFGGYFIDKALKNKKAKQHLANKALRKVYLLFFVFLILIYPVSYVSIYLKANTRIQASDWINKNIAPGKSLAVEHWDDALPVYGAQNYNQLTLPLYDPDSKMKWEGIGSTLKEADYIIIASNRLYVPLQKLTNCDKLPAGKCYKQTSAYYKNLFNGNLGFKKVAEFTDYPTVPILNFKIIDDNADESFTVNDHPKIMIFKKVGKSIDLQHFIN